jgi:hypothetical protein
MPIEEDGASTAVGRRRRSWTGDEKRRIVEESLAAGASIAEVALISPSSRPEREPTVYVASTAWGPANSAA